MSDKTVALRLVFVDEGEYHQETVDIPAASLEKYDRLIDCLREDPEILRRMHIDVDRLVSAHVGG